MSSGHATKDVRTFYSITLHFEYMLLKIRTNCDARNLFITRVELGFELEVVASVACIERELVSGVFRALKLCQYLHLNLRFVFGEVRYICMAERRLR